MLSEKQREIIGDSLTPKFLATCSASGDVNLVMISSIEYYQEMIIFSNLFLWKTARNLEENPDVVVMVINEQLQYFTVKGIFRGFEETGEIVDHLNKTEFTRYNAYTGIRAAGRIEITAVTPLKKMPLSWFLLQFIKSRVAVSGEKPHFPGNVAEKFSMLKSIKVFSYLDDDNNLQLIPLPAFKASGNYLFSPVDLPEGKRYAANVITPNIVSFQLKGTSEKRRLKVEEVYAAGPPVAGKLIYSSVEAGG